MEFRTPVMETAMLIAKGTICDVLGISRSRSTTAIRFQENKLRFTVKLSTKSAPGVAELQTINETIAKIINSNLRIFHINMNRAAAIATYGDAIFDAEGVGNSIFNNEGEDIQLVYIKDHILYASNIDHLHSTNAFDSITVKLTNFIKAKKLQNLIVTFKLAEGNDIPTGNIPLRGEAPSKEVIIALDSKRVEVIPVKKEAQVVSATKITEKVIKDTSVPVEGGDQTDAKATAAVVDPWTVSGDIDYDKLINEFGCTRIEAALLERMEKLTGKKVHHWLRRGLFFSHKDLNVLLDCYERGEKFYLYTGRGPSSDALHMGHLIPFHFTKWLQETFDCPLVIQLTDDEKFLFKENGKDLDYFHKLAWENAKDIIACGFDMDKTFIFSDLDYIGTMYPNILKIQKVTTLNQAMGIFGFSQSDHIGKQAFPAVQVCPSFASTFPEVLGVRRDPSRRKLRCLIPCAIDQDPYFRMARSVAQKVRPKEKKPSLIHSKFFPALGGPDAKMSASDDKSAIFVTDTAKQVKNKINKYAKSGGGETKEDQEKYGANLVEDIPYQYLTFFLQDDAKLVEIAQMYSTGKMYTGEVKKILIDILVDITQTHQENRAKVTDDTVTEFMRVRELKF